jgi:proteasome lid subunit RPN8/RPN11
VRIPRAVVDEILAHALAGYPFEVCGVLVGDGAESSRRVVKALRVENGERESPRVRYQIAPEDLMRIQRQEREAGLEIVGYYHSHPDHPARPSETDRRIAAEGLSDGVIHVVIGVEGGQRCTPTAWVFRDTTQAFETELFEID